MDLSQFIADETGQAVSFDGLAENIGQCEQLVSVYCVKVLDYTPPLIPTAVEWWTNPTILENFEQIAIADLQPGDIVVFGANADINSPVDGHQDIYVAAAENGFTGFDSNWGNVNNAKGQPVAHEVLHTFTDVLGGLRYNGGEEMQNQLNEIAASLSSLYGIVNNLSEIITKTTDPGGRLDTDYANIQTALTDIRASITSLINDNNLKS